MTDKPTCMGMPMAYVSLAVLACQNSAVALLMRFSRSDPVERQYLSSTAVSTAEYAFSRKERFNKRCVSGPLK